MGLYAQAKLAYGIDLGDIEDLIEFSDATTAWLKQHGVEPSIWSVGEWLEQNGKFVIEMYGSDSGMRFFLSHEDFSIDNQLYEAPREITLQTPSASITDEFEKIASEIFGMTGARGAWHLMTAYY